jgi:predicted outer membrane repeat protein
MRKSLQIVFRRLFAQHGRPLDRALVRKPVPFLESLEDRFAPAVFTVNSAGDEPPGDSFLTLRDAVRVIDNGSLSGLSAAEIGQISGTLGSNDTINFDPTTFATEQAITLTGTPEAAELYLTKSMTIQGTGTNLLTISGGDSQRVFEVAKGRSLTISNLTIAAGNAYTSGGGAISANPSTVLSVTNVNFNNNLSADGGAIYTDGTATLTNCTITGNFATYGGAITNSGKITLNNCSFYHNVCSYVYGGGGGMDNFGAAFLTNCSLTKNRAMEGGGIENWGTLSAKNSTFYYNGTAGSLSSGGGAIDNHGGTVTLTSSTLNNNGSPRGGAVRNNFPHAGLMTLTNCTLTGDTASVGGAIYARDDYGLQAGDETTTLTSCTVSGNSAADEAGGVFNGANFSAIDSIIAGNTCSFSPDFFGPVSSGGYNLVGDASFSSGFGVPGDLVGSAASPINPLLGSLASNGGITETMALLAGSPALAAGAAGAGIPLRDQRGDLRGSTPDIGAYEALLSVSISPPIDGHHGVPGQLRTFTVTPTDLHPGTTITYTINWGDGQMDVFGPDANTPVNVSHTYLTPSNYKITVTAVDSTGHSSAPAITYIKIAKAEMQGTTLAVGGTTANDTFRFFPTAAGNNTSVVLNGVTLGSFPASAVSIYSDGGSDTTTINGATGNNAFVVDPSDVVLNGLTIAADSMADWKVIGSPGINGFTVNPGAHGTLVGGTGNSTLTGPSTNNAWQIAGTGQGNINSAVAFQQMQNLVGGTGSNVFHFKAGGSIAGSLNGGGGVNDLSYAGLAGPVVVNLAAGTATGVGGSVSNIEIVHGGSGSNTLTGNSQGNILVGGSGTNNIVGGSGASLLIGGAGSDTVTGNSAAGDIIIGGHTNYDANDTALAAILSEWQNAADSYTQRVARIRGTLAGGLNGGYDLKVTTVHNSTLAATLTGGPGLDWFWANIALDTLNNQQSGEQVN